MSVRALIIDDSPAARKLIGYHLRHLRCEIVGEAETAADGLRLFNQLRPDLITLDLMMPNRDGVDSMALVDTVKRTAPEAGIIVVSSIPFEKLRTDFLEKGVLDYMIKPFNDYTIQRPRVKLTRAFPQLLTIS
jgi:two-component system, chemotaxis family, chemotaxis protein CheY